MRVKKVIGCLITVLALMFLLYGLIYVSLTKGYIGVSGTISYEVLIVALGWILILIGPWLWFGEVPLAVRKFVEARTGRKLEELKR